MATLNGITATTLRMHIPSWGAWWADVELGSEATLSGAVTLVVADLTASGAIVAGGPSKGRSRYRVAGGAAAWGTSVAGRAYRNDAGVKRSVVLRDLASAVGESLDESTITDGSLGNHWVRRAGPAGRVLDQLSPSAWYVDTDGRTKLGSRALTTPNVQGARVEVDAAAGRVMVAANDIAAIVPGAVIDGLTVVDVVHDVQPGIMRTTIYGAGVSASSRRLAAMRRLFEAFAAGIRYAGVWEFRVISQSGERFDLQPVLTSIGMPMLEGVRMRPGVAGCRADVTPGALVLVSFVNADPGRPVVVGFDDPDSDGFAPTRLDLVGYDETVTSGSENGRLVRYGDPIVFSAPGPGTIQLPAVGSLSRVRG